MLNFCCDICGQKITGRFKKVFDESTSTKDCYHEKNEICMVCWNALVNSVPVPVINFPNSEAGNGKK